MPAPYVVISVAVVSVVAVIALKEFVYDPHVAPYLERRRQQRQGPVPVPARSPSASDDGSDDDEPLAPRGGDGDKRDGGRTTIELRDLRTTGGAELRSTNIDTKLRQRNRGAGAPAVLDESNVFLPYDPISPMPLSATETSAPSSPFAPRFQASTPPVIHSPSPRTAISTSRLQSAVTAESTLPSPPATAPVTSPRAHSPAGSARSDSTASSFAPAVVGPSSRAPSAGYGTPRSEGSLLFDVARSPTLDGGSPPRSRAVSPFVAVPGAVSAVGSPAGPSASVVSPERAISPLSPFSDMHSIGSPDFLSPDFRSPSPVFVSPQPSSLHLTAGSHTAVLSPSLRTGMFSPTADSVDDQFDDTSFDGSDFDSWSSVGRRTPSPARR